MALGNDGSTISRLLVGGWQLSQGHRPGEAIDEEALFADLRRMVEAGLTTFDCADIYTGVEELFGRFAKTCDVPLQIHTKYVPDQDALATLTKRDVESTIDRSLQRLGVDRLDLVQFAWWDYSIPRYADAALWLDELREKGKIRHLGATNFDAPRMTEMLEAGIPLVCNQVQYSLLDRRPEHGMAALADRRGFGLLCYGTLAGGFLSERWLGVSEHAVDLSNRSLVKYRLIIDELGGWTAYQELLAVLAEIALEHAVPISAVTLRWVLDRPAVAGAIIGTFHGQHLAANLAALSFELGDEDLRRIEQVLSERPGPGGDCFGLERDLDDRHAAVMKKNLNRD